MRVAGNCSMNPLSRRPRPYWGPKRRGTSLALMAISLVPMVGVMALLFDGGLLLTEQRHARSVADTAAMAAAYSLYPNYSANQGLDPSGAAKTAALSNAAGNGYANDGTTSVVMVNIPPKSGPKVGKAGYAEVLVQYNAAKLFSAVWGHGTMSVTARAVARVMPSPSSPVILLLDPSMPKSLNATGNGDIIATGGSIVVDSSDSQAGNITGNGSVTAPNINFTGSDNTTGNGIFNGTVKTGVAPTIDPLASLPVPTAPATTCAAVKDSGSDPLTLSPGTYSGGIKITGKGDVTLTPGIYYMQGGGFTITGQGSVTGNGVMIYNAPASKNDQVNLTGQGNLTLTPPTSGTYKGISIFQDRNSQAAVTITGQGGMSVTGAIYSAGAEVDLTGNGAMNVVGSQIIANNMKVTGNGSVKVNGTNGSPVRDTRLVE